MIFKHASNPKIGMPKIIASVAAILVLGVTLSIMAAYLTQRAENQKLTAIFNKSAAERVTAIEKELDQCLLLLKALKWFYLSSGTVNRDEFHAFTKPLLKNYQCVHSLQWIPRIAHENRRKFEQAARLSGFKGFVFSQRTDQGAFVPAETRRFYYPVWYTRPQSTVARLFGFDLGSHPGLKKALIRARDTGQMVASLRSLPEFGRTSLAGLLAIIPIFTRNMPVKTALQRQNNLAGFLTTQFNIAEGIKRAFLHLSSQPLNIRIADTTIPGMPQILYRHQPAPTSDAPIQYGFIFKKIPDNLSFSKTIIVADRRWEVNCVPRREFFDTYSSLLPFLTLDIGFLASILLSAYFAIIGINRLRLQKVNQSLALEIKQRKLAQKDLKRYSQNLHGKVEKRTQDLKLAQSELVRKEKLAFLGQIVGGLSHELRGPLSAIKNATYYLKMALSDTKPEIKEMLSIIDGEVQISNQIIGSVLSFARQKQPERTSVAPANVVAKILLRLSKPGNVEVVNHIDAATPHLLVDPDHFSQILNNIILNAFQAMPGGGRLTIDFTVTDSSRMSIRFEDTGSGIPDGIRNQIFEPLFTTKEKGVGLGLAITKTMVDANDGTIEVESKPGHGSAFTIRLPLHKPLINSRY